MFLTRIQGEKIFMTIQQSCAEPASGRVSSLRTANTGATGPKVSNLSIEADFVLHSTPHTPGRPHLSVQNGTLSTQIGTLSMQNGDLSVQNGCENGSFCTLLQNEIIIHLIKSIGLTA